MLLRAADPLPKTHARIAFVPVLNLAGHPRDDTETLALIPLLAGRREGAEESPGLEGGLGGSQGGDLVAVLLEVLQVEAGELVLV